MRIAILIGRLETGGAELAMLELAGELSARGHRVQLFSLMDAADAPALLSGDARFEYLALTGVKTVAAPLVAWQLLTAAWRLRAALRAGAFDVLYSALNIANVIAWLARLRLPLRSPPRWPPLLIWSFHSSSTEQSWEGALATRLCALLSRSVPVAVAVSEAARQHFSGRGVRPRRFVVIPNGTDTTRVKPDAVLRQRQRAAWGVGDDRILIGVVARVSAVKAPERLLAALSIICADMPELQAVWVGAGPSAYVAQLRQQAMALGLADRVRFVGPSRDVCAALNAFDIFALLSRWEGAPRALAEAMAVGLPCVIDQRAGAETLAGCGLTVDGDAVEDVAGAFKQLALDATLRSRLGAAARAHVHAALTLGRTTSATEALFTDADGHRAVASAGGENAADRL